MFVKGGLKVSNQKREVNEHHKDYQSGLETKHQITSSPLPMKINCLPLRPFIIVGLY